MQCCYADVLELFLVPQTWAWQQHAMAVSDAEVLLVFGDQSWARSTSTCPSSVYALPEAAILSAYHPFEGIAPRPACSPQFTIVCKVWFLAVQMLTQMLDLLLALHATYQRCHSTCRRPADKQDQPRSKQTDTVYTTTHQAPLLEIGKGLCGNSLGKTLLPSEHGGAM